MPPELRGSRLLLVYLAVVGLAGAIVSGPLFRPIVNYLLLAGYAAVIRWWVREDKPLETHELPTRPRRDVAVIVVVVAVAIAGVIWSGSEPVPEASSSGSEIGWSISGSIARSHRRLATLWSAWLCSCYPPSSCRLRPVF